VPDLCDLNFNNTSPVPGRTFSAGRFSSARLGLASKPVAVLLSITDEDKIERLLIAHSPRFRSIVELAEQQIREGEDIKHADFWHEIESETALAAFGKY
jgi:hypothetical protein